MKPGGFTRKKVFVLSAVAAAGVALFWITRPPRMDPAVPGPETPDASSQLTEREEEVATRFDIPAEALISRPHTRVPRPELEDPAAPGQTNGPPEVPRVALSRIFAPYTGPSLMLSHSPGATPLHSPVDVAPPGASVRTEEHPYGTFLATDLRPSARLSDPSRWKAVQEAQPDKPAPMTVQPPAAPPIPPGDPESITRAMYQVREGEVNLEAGDASAALRSFLAALALYPRMSYANHQAGLLYIAAGNYAQAVHHLRLAAESAEYISEIMNDLGIALLFSGQASQALSAFDAALQDDPENEAPLVNAGLALRRLGRLDEAWERLMRYRERFPEDARVCRELAMVAIMRGDREEAMDYLDFAMSRDPQWEVPVLDAALIHADAGDVARAMGYLDRALELAPARHVYEVYQQPAFRDVRLGPEGREFEARLAAKARREH